MDISQSLSCSLIIFGGTGDLTHRKLLPAIYNLSHEGKLPQNLIIVSVGRRDKTNEEYRLEAYEAIKEFSRFKIDDKVWERIKDKIYYKRTNFAEGEKYSELNSYLNKIEEKNNIKGNRIYYLAVAPRYFGVIVDNLNSYGMNYDEHGWRRIVIEKPFGSDLESARYLNKKIVNVFKEENIFRIDHYLGKEMLQNIMVIRFANTLFEPLWNNRFIDHIQITSSETVGVESRGRYYEKAGAIRDMVQNHMLQLLSLVAMEPPNDLDSKSIRDEKVKVLRTLKEIPSENINEYVVRGQYGELRELNGELIPGYRDEKYVSPNSNTETFMAMKIYVDNFRWAGVPFYIRTGKRMAKKTTEIIIQFKTMRDVLYFKEKELSPNRLVIKVQPKEGTFLQFNAKKPGTYDMINQVHMDYCQNCQVGMNSPEAYERLLIDVIKGDATLFTRWDEVEYSWKFIDSIINAWKEYEPNFPNYDPGTWGPKESDLLLQKDNRFWINNL